jgi:hypothetical protein
MPSYPDKYQGSQRHGSQHHDVMSSYFLYNDCARSEPEDFEHSMNMMLVPIVAGPGVQTNVEVRRRPWNVRVHRFNQFLGSAWPIGLLSLQKPCV